MEDEPLYVYGRDHILMDDGKWSRLLKGPKAPKRAVQFTDSLLAWRKAREFSRGYDAHVVVIHGDRIIRIAEPDWEDLANALTSVTAERDAAQKLACDHYSKYRRVITLLKNTKMQHGTCKPRSRQACTACNAQDELDEIIAADKGSVVRLA